MGVPTFSGGTGADLAEREFSSPTNAIAAGAIGDPLEWAGLVDAVATEDRPVGGAQKQLQLL